MEQSCVFTIVAKNYLSYARTLMKSFASFHPEVRRFVLLADRNDGWFDPGKEPFEVVEAHALGIENFPSLAFKYNVVELSTAVKPFFFKYLFSRYHFKDILFFDPDILFFKGITEIFGLFDRYPLLLMPHITRPIPDDGRFPDEHTVVKAGVFNLGFIGIAASEETDALLQWWCERLYDKCRYSPFVGYGVDQLWMNLVPGLCEDYLVLRQPEYNVAYWNLHERAITKTEAGFVVNEKHPLVFFHFSGFDFDAPDMISRFQDRFTIDSFPVLKELLYHYKDLLTQNGYPETRTFPYWYGSFTNGGRIPNVCRRIYWGLGKEAAKMGDPFSHFYWKLLSRCTMRAFFTKRFRSIALDQLLLYKDKSLR